MTYDNDKKKNRYLNERLMERIFNFPRLYRLKIWMVSNTFQLIKPLIAKNYFTFNEILFNILPEGSNVFEIGCGNGKLYQELRLNCNNIKYTGIDINKSMIEYCSAQFPDAAWECYNSLPYPYPDDYFEFCIIEHVLHHLNSYAEICSLLTESLRIARKVIICEPLQSDNRFLYFMNSFYWRITDGGKVYLTYAEFHSLFNSIEAKLKWEKVTEPLHQIYCCELSRAPVNRNLL